MKEGFAKQRAVGWIRRKEMECWKCTFEARVTRKFGPDVTSREFQKPMNDRVKALSLKDNRVAVWINLFS